MPTEDDPEARREARRQAAKEAVAAMTSEERLARVEHLNPRPVRASTTRLSPLPTSTLDPTRSLTGEFDLVYPVHIFSDHMTGPGDDWVDVTELGFPHGLRQGGWLYLKSDGRVGARCRAVQVEFRENLHEHTADASGAHAALRQAAVLALDASTWELVDFPAHEHHLQGYRYATTDDAAGTVTHLIGGHPDGTFALRSTG